MSFRANRDRARLGGVTSRYAAAMRSIVWWPLVLGITTGCPGPEGVDAGQLALDAGPEDAGVDAGFDAGVIDCSAFAPIVLSGAFVDAPSAISVLEVHNRTSHSVDLSAWTMRVRSVGGFLVAPLAGTVTAGGFRSFANDAGVSDEVQPLLRLGTDFASIELIGPNGNPCTAEGDWVTWGTVMPICTAGAPLSSLPSSTTRIGYRRDDPCAEPSQRWLASTAPHRNVNTPPRLCGCP